MYKAWADRFKRLYPKCQLQVEGVCTGKTQGVHHVWKVSQGGPREPKELPLGLTWARQFKAACNPCNDWIESNPNDADALGFLIRRQDAVREGWADVVEEIRREQKPTRAKDQQEALRKRGANNKMRSKVYEREVAKRLGTTRVTDSHGDSRCDVICGAFDVEVKSRARGFADVVNLLDEAKQKARPNQTPVLVAVHRGTRVRKLAIMELDDWADWLAGGRDA